MKNKLILFVSIFAVIFAVVIVGGLVYFKKDQKKIRIAACPTYHNISKKLPRSEYQVLETGSTAESITLFINGQIDMFLSGRTLKPGEAVAKSVVIGEGFSFLNDSGFTLDRHEIKKYPVFTNLDVQVLKDKLPEVNIFKVDDVYQFMKQGIVITSWENTDYSRARIVQIFEDNGTRLPLSRRATLFYNLNIAEDGVRRTVDYLLM